MPPPDGCHHNPNEDDENSPTSPLNFLDQNYQELHQNCLTENTLYNDELFPPDNSSIGSFDDEPPVVDMSQVVWKRPSELVSDPNFIVDDVSSLFQSTIIKVRVYIYNQSFQSVPEETTV
ncbi:hypothetical protein PO909_012001 [Leuciscus waleckii]